MFFVGCYKSVPDGKFGNTQYSKIKIQIVVAERGVYVRLTYSRRRGIVFKSEGHWGLTFSLPKTAADAVPSQKSLADRG